MVKKNKKPVTETVAIDEAELKEQEFNALSELEANPDIDGETIISGSIKVAKEDISAPPEILKALTLKPLDKYRFERTIGIGGMKAIVQVKDKDTTRSVAMAVIPGFEDRPKEDVMRFIQEARITARLEHPNIVPVHDIGVDSTGAPYFTMKLLRGRTLAGILLKMREEDQEYLDKYDLPRLLRIYVKVCNAIAFAHSKKILHLDIKPENIHVGDYGEVQVLDWGLARFVGEDEPAQSGKSKTIVITPEKIKMEPSDILLTMDGITKGTPGYMAPEQAAGKNSEKDERTDIYALGAILYAILTFDNPMAGKDVDEVIASTIVGNLESPRDSAGQERRTIPPALEAIAMKAMQLDPEERYQTVSDLRSDIFSYMSGYATAAEEASSLKKTVMFVNRNILLITLVIVLLLLIALAGGLAFLYVNNLVDFKL